MLESNATGGQDIGGQRAAEPVDARHGTASPLEGTILNGKRVELPGGRILDFSGIHPPPGATARTASVVDVIEPFRFDVCPICLAADATTKEHVPPAALGGRTTTATCFDCNHRFGPLEAELDLHTRGSSRAPSFTAEAVVGSRRASAVSVAYQADGTPVWVLDRTDPAVGDMLRSGALDMTFTVPRPELWRTALLKHAYLAACVYLQAIPASHHAELVRAELLRARAAGTRHEIGLFADALPTLRGYAAPPWPLYVAVADMDGRQLAMIGLGRYGLVSWPFADLRDEFLGRLRARRPQSPNPPMR